MYARSRVSLISDAHVLASLGNTLGYDVNACLLKGGANGFNGPLWPLRSRKSLVSMIITISRRSLKYLRDYQTGLRTLFCPAHSLTVLSRKHNFPNSSCRFATMATDLTKYKFNHSMIRVKDPQASVKFYEFLGMKLINKLPNPDAKFDLYFLAYDGSSAISGGKHWTDREGIVELTHNYGSENDPNFKVANGNAEPGKGFGHLCVSVDNIQAACKRLEDAGYGFQKKLTDGRMKSIAFALDPDGYWVEIIGQNPADKTESVTTTDVTKYRMASNRFPDCHETLLQVI